MSDLAFTAIVNGRKVSRSAKPSQRLLDFIRDDLNLTGNKEGCGAGECGAGGHDTVQLGQHGARVGAASDHG